MTKHAAILASVRASLARPEAALYFRKPKKQFPVKYSDTGEIVYPFHSFRQALNYAAQRNTEYQRALRTRGELDHPPQIAFQVGWQPCP